MSENLTQSERDFTEVAVGILLRDNGDFLLTTRPPGAYYEGYWEFPGGKLEAGESVDQALRRELYEELGIIIGSTKVWQIVEHDYPHALVRLHCCIVPEWAGELEMREGQNMSWQRLPPTVEPILPTALSVLRWLGEENKQF